MHYTVLGYWLSKLTDHRANVATIARMPYIHRLKSLDFLWATTDLAIWSVVEVGISIIAAAATTLRPLFSHTSRFTNSPSVLKNSFNPSRTSVFELNRFEAEQAIGQSAMVSRHEVDAVSTPVVFHGETTDGKRHGLVFDSDFAEPYKLYHEDDQGLKDTSNLADVSDNSRNGTYTGTHTDGVDVSAIARAY
jgi:hypothetical protein